MSKSIHQYPNRLSIYKEVIAKAFAHGEDSDPDHEIGDLQDVLKAALRLMTKEQLTLLKPSINRIFEGEG